MKCVPIQSKRTTRGPQGQCQCISGELTHWLDGASHRPLLKDGKAGVEDGIGANDRKKRVLSQLALDRLRVRGSLTSPTRPQCRTILAGNFMGPSGPTSTSDGRLIFAPGPKRWKTKSRSSVRAAVSRSCTSRATAGIGRPLPSPPLTAACAVRRGPALQKELASRSTRVTPTNTAVRWHVTSRSSAVPDATGLVGPARNAPRMRQGRIAGTRNGARCFPQSVPSAVPPPTCRSSPASSRRCSAAPASKRSEDASVRAPNPQTSNPRLNNVAFPPSVHMEVTLAFAMVYQRSTECRLV